MTLIFIIVLCAIAQKKKGDDGEKNTIIGIDLGTTYSCVGVYMNGSVKIIPNEHGNTKTPSIVTFTDDDILVGEAAKNQATINPQRTLYDVKRLIGRKQEFLLTFKYADQIVQYDKIFMPYDIVDNATKPYIKVSNFKGFHTKTVAPEEISAIVLTKMKEISERYLGKKVTEAIGHKPNYFNAAQRKATYDAGAISGLGITIMNELIAAIIAHGLDKEGQKNILVFDLGCRTFDVSILAINYDEYEIIANSGDTQLGGENFNQRVIDHFMKVIKNKNNKDISGDKIAIYKLKTEVEKAKIELSSTDQTRIEIKDLADGLDFKEVLTRTQFEVLNANLFKKIVGSMYSALEDSGLKKNQIHEYILVGGSSRIPKIRQIVDDFFDGKKSLTGFSPDEAVCYGAAILGGIICDEKSNRSIHEIKIIPFSLGVETSGGIMTKIIPKGSNIPTKNSLVVTTYQYNQQSVNITILEGERLFAKDNYYLGQFNITGVLPAKGGKRYIEVKFEIDFDGVLIVSAFDYETVSRKEIFIIRDSQRLSKADIDKLLKEAEGFAEYDKVAKGKIDAKNSLESYIYQMKNQIDDSEKLAKKLSDDDKSAIKDCLIASHDWLDKNQNAEKEDYEEELKELEEFINPIVMKAQQKYDSNLKAKSYLESYRLSVKNEINNLENLAKELKEALKSNQDWFENAQKKDYQEELKELKKIVTPIINRIYEQKVDQKKQANYDDYDDDL